MKQTKRKAILSTLLAVVVVAACRNDNKLPQPAPSDATSVTKAMSQIAQQDPDAMRAAYRTLRPSEKRQEWLDHFQWFQASRALSANQLSTITALRTYVASYPFLDQPEQGAESWYNAWANNANQYFTAREIHILSCTLQTDETEIDRELGLVATPGTTGPTGPGPVKQKKCNCNTPSIVSCGIMTGVYCKEPQNGCITSDVGCGGLWVWKCNGRCPELY